MLKQTILALASIATLSISLVPVTSAPALAQSRIPCTAGPQCDDTPGGGSSFNECTAPLGILRRVYEEELDAVVNPNEVSIVPICIGEDGMFRNDGNAGKLRIAIADNEAMMEALFRRNFGSDDVVGVRMIGDEQVILYVYPFHHYY